MSIAKMAGKVEVLDTGQICKCTKS